MIELALILNAIVITQQSLRSYLGLVWLLFLIYWVAAWLYDIATSKAKKTVKQASLLYNWATRGAAILLVLSLFLIPGIISHRLIPVSTVVSVIGLVLAFAGIIFAIWARITLGGNWSANVTLKKGHTLMKKGPYSITRNPIYTGLVIGLIGAFLTLGDVFTLVALAIGLAYCLYKIKLEERFMIEEFGTEYKAYMKNVKKLIPFVY